MSYKLAVFDLDGTLLDTLEDLTDAVNHALTEHDMPERTIDEVRRFVGNGIRKLIERAVPENTGLCTVDSVFQCFSLFYKDHSAEKTCPYKNIPEELSFLKQNGCLLAVISNKADFAVQSLVEHYFPGIFDFVAGERKGIERKPSPDAVFEALKALGTEKKDCVYIGDSEVDIETARNAGVDLITVSWGFREKSYLRTLTDGIIIDKPSELKCKII